MTGFSGSRLSGYSRAASSSVEEKNDTKLLNISLNSFTSSSLFRVTRLDLSQSNDDTGLLTCVDAFSVLSNFDYCTGVFMAFPSHFTWGAATASYQIEGAWDEDGRLPSIWDVFSAEPEKTYQGHTGKVACDHYHRYREDVSLMKEIGLPAYRFSTAWPRIIPDGRGAVNQKGLDFYSRLVDELLAANIEPWVTLYHWDLPHSLQLEGGWCNPSIVGAFEAYTEAVVNALGDRVSKWMTFNEPQCFIGLSLSLGVHAPGYKLPQGDVIKAAHHSMVAHGRAVDILRSKGGASYSIGYVPTTQSMIPPSESAEDIELARHAFFDHTPARPVLWTISLFSDPVFLGSYPESLLPVIEQDLPKGWQNDMPVIGRELDFIGINLYSSKRLERDEAGVPRVKKDKVGVPQTALKWNVEDETLRWGCRFLWERYKKPVIVTENGLANADWVHVDGKVHDASRIDFTTRYLRGLEKAIDDGADIAGYFHWSLMDNFEWAEGYKERFGLIHVDFETQKRTVKDSGYWYREVIRSNGAIIH